jgi:NADH:ubiquinone oxidoreductase subunit F (NADH-binding)/(2Fe-2S) ferredoxin/NAD-dependent dihydropyrimidine dehydrogenase PreA subunit
MKKIKTLEQLEQFRKDSQAKRDPKKTVISICVGTGCLALGAEKVAAALKEEIQFQGLVSKVASDSIRETGCPGFCERGPIVVIYPEGTCYLGVTVDDVPEIVSKTIANNEVIERLVYKDPDTKKRVVKDSEIPFYKKQQRYLLGNNNFIDSKSIEDYISLGGYSALAKVLSVMKSEEVIQEVIDANLRGRGGGGFPAGWKWHSTRHADGDPKYVICNADEGDPGAFMDRALLEGNPHSVLEGMIIGAYAIGSNEGYIYVRNEYPLAVTNATLALDQARELGFLGENILGSGFGFDIKIMRGGGAFVCGESSALFASLEGRSGEPRAKYIHATDKGLWDKPTNLNNVETWANVPLIINKGAKWYTGIGTEGSKGTKIFSLVGKINNTGLVEVPMGITLREIIYDIGGGIPDGKKFKAVQTGGPSGGCIPEAHLDTPVDFDELTKLGSMMGSGGMIVMDENNCMVDVANYFLKFLEEESCGKCTPCREGILQMRKILDRITSGEGKDEDLDTLQWMSRAIIDGSLCALGGAAPNPVITTMRYFRDEYEAHIRDKKCPAGVCKALIKYSIDPENCTGCHLCARICPVEAATGEKKEVHTIDTDICIKCRACYEVCKFDAIKIM